ncbi:NADH:flavin oxidoreductase/NADH oxidase [Leucobacter viscericola]|uniref:NADH:flavin oxidoreductase/NADH oxidase n=1 Tax=Leucobacter viscericola TaxID=2714935 RepID=A0A6G7XIZ2_9MICO|nr:NADH:flavin oxidoreductase/NADH oxidase [Leucobacter viscericola]QIK64341.1 NADH:flavin oxidoreductase/NADH oxidase [Leucobacter viscericola]
MADPILFHPITVRNLEIRNRLWVAPMCQYTAVDGVVGDWHLQHLGGLARGGAGLVTMEATGVVPEGRISPNCPGIWNEDQLTPLRHIVEVVHSHGAKIGIQLAHAGRKGSTYPSLPELPSGSVPVEEGGWETVAPSAIPFGDYATPRALETSELPALVSAFAAGADRAVSVGFDLVEIHAAHGYLLHEFLSPLSNKRTDEYGGDLAGRSRLLLEIVRAIRANHPGLPISVRISATEWVEGGFTVEESTELSALLDEAGADFVSVSSAANVPNAPIPVGPSYQVGLAAAVRRGPLPVGAVGLITTSTQAEGILATGQADVILLARPLLTNPHLPITWAHELRAPAAASLVPPQYARARF